MAHAFATGASPFWSPNIFAGWPNIADPQSMLASPLHVLLAYVSASPSFRAIDGITFAYLFIGGLGIILFFRDRGWHSAGGLVAALAFAFGGAASGIGHDQMDRTRRVVGSLRCVVGQAGNRCKGDRRGERQVLGTGRVESGLG